MHKKGRSLLWIKKPGTCSEKKCCELSQVGHNQAIETDKAGPALVILLMRVTACASEHQVSNHVRYHRDC